MIQIQVCVRQINIFLSRHAMYDIQGGSKRGKLFGGKCLDHRLFFDTHFGAKILKRSFNDSYVTKLRGRASKPNTNYLPERMTFKKHEKQLDSKNLCLLFLNSHCWRVMALVKILKCYSPSAYIPTAFSTKQQTDFEHVSLSQVYGALKK